MEKEQKRSQSEPLHKILRQEYWIDFLGGILPGTLVVNSILLIFIPTTLLSANLLSNLLNQCYEPLELLDFVGNFLNAVQNTPNVLWFGIIISGFFMIYIIGHIFYRKDPQKPNRLSLERLIKLEAKKNNVSYNNYIEYLNNDKNDDEYNKFKLIIQKEYACTSKKDCEFPYPYFNMYLENRGLEYLNKFVPWKKNLSYRTKNFINVLKIRLKFLYPEDCGIIIRNEAHVRLASSAWYAGRLINLFSCISIVALIVIILICLYFGAVMDIAFLLKRYSFSIGTVLVLQCLMAIFGYLLKIHIEKFLHYQRQREIVHVLETAWTAFEISDNSKFKMYPPFEGEYAQQKSS